MTRTTLAIVAAVVAALAGITIAAVAIRDVHTVRHDMQQLQQSGAKSADLTQVGKAVGDLQVRMKEAETQVDLVYNALTDRATETTLAPTPTFPVSRVDDLDSRVDDLRAQVRSLSDDVSQVQACLTLIVNNLPNGYLGVNC